MARKFLSMNPFTQQVLKEYKFHSSSEITTAIASSHEAFKKFSAQSFTQRAEKLLNLGNLLIKYKTELGTIMSSEMGKPISQSYQERVKSSDCCSYYAMNAENLLQSLNYPVGNDCYVTYEPIGSLFLIMPFNFPV